MKKKEDATMKDRRKHTMMGREADPSSYSPLGRGRKRGEREREERDGLISYDSRDTIERYIKATSDQLTKVHRPGSHPS
jgi:hypothetical protein